MNRLMLLLAVLSIAFFLTASPVPAAEPTAEDYVAYHMPLLGSWKATAEEGDQTFSGTIEWRLGPGRKSFLVKVDLKGLPVVQFIQGFDPVTRKFVGTSFDAKGTYQVTTLEVAGMSKGKKLGVGPIGKWEETRFSADGSTVKATETLSCTEMGKDRMVFVWSNRSEEGKSLPDWKLTYERPAASAEGLKDFQEYAETMVGEWEGELVLAGDVPGVGKNGEKVKACGSIAWTCDKTGLEGQYEFGSAKGKWFTVCDPESRRIREFGLESTGAVSEARIAKEQGKWVARNTTVYPDGTKRSVTDTLTVEDGGKTHIHVGVVFLNGKKQPGYRDVWKRVK